MGVTVKHDGLGVAFELTFYNPQTVAFERAVRERAEARADDPVPETQREYWEWIVRSAARCGALNAKQKDIDTMKPAVIQWLAERVTEAYSEATTIPPE